MLCGRTRSKVRLDGAAHAVLATSGALFSLVGLVLAFGGYESPEGSALDVLVGIGLIVSGSFLSLRHRAGAWTYVLVFAGTVSWSLRDVAIASSLERRPVERPADDAAVSQDRHPYSIFERPDERSSAMMYDWQTSLRTSDHYAAKIVPPAAVKETGWDILLALHSDRHCSLLLGKLASIVSVSEGVMNLWLGALEERELITGTRHPTTNELLAVLTEKGRDMLDRYFSATNDLQLSAHT